MYAGLFSFSFINSPAKKSPLAEAIQIPSQLFSLVNWSTKNRHKPIIEIIIVNKLLGLSLERAKYGTKIITNTGAVY